MISLKKFWPSLKGWQKGGMVGFLIAVILIILVGIEYTSQLSLRLLWYTAFPVLTALVTLVFSGVPLYSFLTLFIFLMIFVYLSFLGMLFGFLYEKKSKKSFITILIIFWSVYLILSYLATLFLRSIIFKRLG